MLHPARDDGKDTKSVWRVQSLFVRQAGAAIPCGAGVKRTAVMGGRHSPVPQDGITGMNMLCRWAALPLGSPALRPWTTRRADPASWHATSLSLVSGLCGLLWYAWRGFGRRIRLELCG